MSLENLDLDKVEWLASLLLLVVARILESGFHCYKINQQPHKTVKFLLSCTVKYLS